MQDNIYALCKKVIETGKVYRLKSKFTHALPPQARARKDKVVLWEEDGKHLIATMSAKADYEESKRLQKRLDELEVLHQQTKSVKSLQESMLALKDHLKDKPV